MSERFTKFNSGYIMRSRHQKTKLGTIMERDWPTTNGLNVLRFGAGRRIWYNSGNFVFTTSNIPTYHKKHKLTTETQEWDWDDCKDADGTVNDVRPPYETNDIRDYVYYGSCVEMIRATIEEIISDFPGRLVRTSERMLYNGDNIISVKRKENLDAITPMEGDIVYSEKKYFNGTSWHNLTIIKDELDGISNYGANTVCYDESFGTVKIIKIKDGKKYFEPYGKYTSDFDDHYVESENKYYIYNFLNKKFTENKTIVSKLNGFVVSNQFNIDLIHKSVTLGKYDNEFRFMSNSWKKYCIKTVKNDKIIYENVIGYEIGDWLGDLNCPRNDEGVNVVNVTFKTDGNKTYTLNGYSINGNVIFAYKGSDLLTIQPQKEYIDDYFFNLTGFKGQLLRKDTKPLYTNKFKTPVEFNFTWYYPEKYYCWPSEDYCIDIDSMTFTTFVNSLIDMAQKYDELWTDNIYRSMTHESIKNFDWTYSRDYYEGDEQDNINGGERMMRILRVFGRVFDDVKFYIDSIKHIPNITYDKINNGPEALLSDSVSLKGLDAISTISSDYDINAVITEDSLSKNSIKDVSWIDSPLVSDHKKWYQSRNSEDIYPDVCDNEIMRRFNLSVKRLMQTKGTQHAIDMIMGFFGFGRDPFSKSSADDYWVTEEAFYTKKLIRYNECVNGKNDDGKPDGDNWTTNEEYRVVWNNISSNLKGDVISEANYSKKNDLLYYDDPYSGIPLRTILIGSENEAFVVPYYDPYVMYDGNLVFQGKGGWAKFINPNDTDHSDDCFNYQETMSYLHVVGTIGDLMGINANKLQKYDIYYVVNINDYTDFDENPPYDNENITPSHYFVIMNDNEPEKFASWQNVVIKPTGIDGDVKIVDKESFDTYFNTGNVEWYYDSSDIKTPTDEQIKGTYSYIFKHIKYLESIMSTNVGNNPHVGYGNYDDGNEFFEYMEKPFKYAIDKKLIGDFNYENIAQQVTFDDIRKNKVNDKIQIIGYTKNENGKLVSHYNKSIVPNPSEKPYMVMEDVGDYKAGDTITEDDYNGLNNSDKKKCEKNGVYMYENDPFNIWYINTKIITIENNVVTQYLCNEDITIDNVEYKKGDAISYYMWLNLTDTQKEKFIKGDRLFKDYFKNIIMPYLLQVIPSTTILKLKGF